ncbi:MAG: (deoxy)nucleoside triphosphate pyrophosphohydrolase [Pseudobdellovibrionaceae bacterium]
MKSPDPTPVVAGIFYRWNPVLKEPEVLLFQRAFEDVGGGHWEFPGGKVEAGESDSQALIRELDEEISIQVKVQEMLGTSLFQAPTGKHFELRVYFVEGPIEKIVLLEHEAMKWVRASTFVLDEIADGDRPLMELCFEKLVQVYVSN